MNEGRVIRCRCEHHNIVGVVLPDGRLEVRKDGKSTIVSGGDVVLACLRCRFELRLDTAAELAVV